MKSEAEIRKHVQDIEAGMRHDSQNGDETPELASGAMLALQWALGDNPRYEDFVVDLRHQRSRQWE